MEDKKHWYDGRFYETFIAPNQDRTFRTIKNLINKGSSVIDAGCGTGRLADFLIDNVSDYTGIDPSSKNIRTAQSLRKHYSVSYFNTDIISFLKSAGRSFDYAVISYVIHEIDPAVRISVLKTLAEYSNNIIVADYACPPPGIVMKLMNEMVEYAAGREHYSNYKNFMRTGGVINLAGNAGLEILSQTDSKTSSVQITILRGKGKGI